MVGSDGNGV